MPERRLPPDEGVRRRSGAHARRTRARGGAWDRSIGPEARPRAHARVEGLVAPDPAELGAGADRSGLRRRSGHGELRRCADGARRRARAERRENPRRHRRPHRRPADSRDRGRRVARPCQRARARRSAGVAAGRRRGACRARVRADLRALRLARDDREQRPADRGTCRPGGGEPAAGGPRGRGNRGCPERRSGLARLEPERRRRGETGRPSDQRVACPPGLGACAERRGAVHRDDRARGRPWRHRGGRPDAHERRRDLGRGRRRCRALAHADRSVPGAHRGRGHVRERFTARRLFGAADGDLHRPRARRRRPQRGRGFGTGARLRRRDASVTVAHSSAVHTRKARDLQDRLRPRDPPGPRRARRLTRSERHRRQSRPRTEARRHGRRPRIHASRLSELQRGPESRGGESPKDFDERSEVLTNALRKCAALSQERSTFSGNMARGPGRRSGLSLCAPARRAGLRLRRKQAPRGSGPVGTASFEPHGCRPSLTLRWICFEPRTTTRSMWSPGFFDAMRSTRVSMEGTGLPSTLTITSPPAGQLSPSTVTWFVAALRAAFAAPLPGRTEATSTPLVTGRWKRRAMFGCSVFPSIPRKGCSTLPCLISSATTSLTVLIGIAKPMPTLPWLWPPVSICALTPMTWPCAFSSGPPELPWFSAASVWITCEIDSWFGASIRRWTALTIPAVTERSRPNGFPIAITWSPTRTKSELPSGRGLSARDLTWTSSTAISVDGSTPTTVALKRSLFEKLTWIVLAPRTTW